MDAQEIFIQTCMEMGAAEVLRTLGLHSGEITQRDALRTYGTYFRDAVADGRIKPCRYGNGARPAKYFRVKDILMLKAKDSAPAELKFKQ